MESPYPDFIVFPERLANRPMMLALECHDAVSRQKLIGLASEYRQGNRVGTRKRFCPAARRGDDQRLAAL